MLSSHSIMYLIAVLHRSGRPPHRRHRVEIRPFYKKNKTHIYIISNYNEEYNEKMSRKGHEKSEDSKGCHHMNGATIYFESCSLFVLNESCYHAI